jgi:hypothetical protein
MNGKNRGFLTDIDRVVDVLQDLIIKVELLLQKVEETIALLKAKNNGNH